MNTNTKPTQNRAIPTEFLYYTDPGHGWVAVKRWLLERLDVAHEITSYSYALGSTVYLEEDCDAATFANAYQRVFGTQPKFIERNYPHRDAPMRRYARYQANAN